MVTNCRMCACTGRGGTEFGETVKKEQGWIFIDWCVWQRCDRQTPKACFEK